MPHLSEALKTGGELTRGKGGQGCQDGEQSGQTQECAEVEEGDDGPPGTGGPDQVRLGRRPEPLMGAPLQPLCGAQLRGQGQRCLRWKCGKSLTVRRGWRDTAQTQRGGPAGPQEPRTERLKVWLPAGQGGQLWCSPQGNPGNGGQEERRDPLSELEGRTPLRKSGSFFGN